MLYPQGNCTRQQRVQHHHLGGASREHPCSQSSARAVLPSQATCCCWHRGAWPHRQNSRGSDPAAASCECLTKLAFVLLRHVVFLRAGLLPGAFMIMGSFGCCTSVISDETVATCAINRQHKSSATTEGRRHAVACNCSYQWARSLCSSQQGCATFMGSHRVPV